MGVRLMAELGFEVVDLGQCDHVSVGDEAPGFTRPLVYDEYWENVALSAVLEDGPVLLVFHPMVGAFPATYIWKEIKQREWDNLLQVRGVAISSPYSQKNLLRERGLEDRDVALFSDPQNGVAESFGIQHALDGMAGIQAPRPAVFLVDSSQTVRYTWVAEEWPAFPPYDTVEDELTQFEA